MNIYYSHFNNISPSNRTRLIHYSGLKTSHRDPKVARANVKIDFRFANYFLKTNVKKKCFNGLKFPCLVVWISCELLLIALNEPPCVQ